MEGGRLAYYSEAIAINQRCGWDDINNIISQMLQLRCRVQYDVSAVISSRISSGCLESSEYN